MRAIVRVAGKEVRAASTSSLKSVTDWREIVASFVASQDVRESSRSLYARTLSLFFEWIERTGRELDSLNREDVLAYKDSLSSSGLAPLTIGSYIVAVRKFYSWAEALLLYPNIAKGVKTPRRKNDFEKAELTNRQSSELLAHTKESSSLRDYAIINLVLRTGLRTIEVVRANLEDITYKTATDERTGEEVTQRVLRVWGKGHDERDSFVVLTDKTFEPIKAYLRTRKNARAKEPLFVSDSRRNAGERLTTRSISRLCKESLVGIGLDGREYTAHSLRHTTGAAIYRQTGDITQVQKVLRHSNPATSQIYARRAISDSRIVCPPELCVDAAF